MFWIGLVPVFRKKNKEVEMIKRFELAQYPYLPTPPLGQDMTQGQFFLSRV